MKTACLCRRMASGTVANRPAWLLHVGGGCRNAASLMSRSGRMPIGRALATRTSGGIQTFVRASAAQPNNNKNSKNNNNNNHNTPSRGPQTPSLSSLARAHESYYHEEDNFAESPTVYQFCPSCLASQRVDTNTAGGIAAAATVPSSAVVPPACGHTETLDEPLPEPLPEPKYTFLRRVLSRESCVSLQSATGQQRLIESLTDKTAVSYIPLTSHFVHQSDPAYCGLTTLLVVLNALAVDPNRRWRGGWRYFGNEDIILDQCPCLPPLRVQRSGTSMVELARLATCQGLGVTLKRPPASNEESQVPSATTKEDGTYSLDDFRNDVVNVLADNGNYEEQTVMVVSYFRPALQQTGEGHFSPVAAYHAESDSCLILDVARFKYPPFWVSLQDLYHAMQPVDPSTQLPRGWMLWQAPLYSHQVGLEVADEAKRLAENVPYTADEVAEACPGHTVKVTYCPNNARLGKTNK